MHLSISSQAAYVHLSLSRVAACKNYCQKLLSPSFQNVRTAQAKTPWILNSYYLISITDSLWFTDSLLSLISHLSHLLGFFSFLRRQLCTNGTGGSHTSASGSFGETRGERRHLCSTCSTQCASKPCYPRYSLKTTHFLWFFVKLGHLMEICAALPKSPKYTQLYFEGQRSFSPLQKHT